MQRPSLILLAFALKDKLFPPKPRVRLLCAYIAGPLTLNPVIATAVCGVPADGLIGPESGPHFRSDGAPLAKVILPFGDPMPPSGVVVAEIEGIGCDTRRRPIPGARGRGRVSVPYEWVPFANGGPEWGFEFGRIELVSAEPLPPLR